MENIELFAHAYFVSAIAYNILSQVWSDVFGRRFSSTDPVNGIQVISMVYLIFLLREAMPAPAFVFLMSVWLVLVVRFGIFQHLQHYSEQSYLSRLSWAAAITINVLGVVVVGLFVVR